MKYSLLFASLASGLILFAPPVAAAPNSGDLIKASGSTVYYFGADSQRYVFPTEKTYFSWYADFATVKTITDAELATYQLKANVTYRAGTRLLKVTTDPRVYAVAKGGVLRWVQTEEVARTLYGTDWAKKVDDLPDPFFINYTIGTPIANAADFSPTNEMAADTTINQDKNLTVLPPVTPPVTPTSTPPVIPPTASTYGLILTASNLTPLANSSLSLSARTKPTTVSEVKLFFDNSLIKQCSQIPCGTDLTIPNNYAVGRVIFARAEVIWQDQHRETATTTLTIAPLDQAVSVIVNPEIVAGGQRTITANVDPAFSSAKIKIFIDDIFIKICSVDHTCTLTDYEPAATGTTHTVYAQALSANENESARSANVTYRVVDNEHPQLIFTYDRLDIFTGETTQLSLAAGDSNGIASTEFWLDGQLVKQCTGSSCNLTAGPWTAPRTVQYVGKATDATGLTTETNATVITVH